MAPPTVHSPTARRSSPSRSVPGCAGSPCWQVTSTRAPWSRRWPPRRSSGSASPRSSFMSNTLEWAESIRTEGVVREAFPEARSALVHDADVAAVAAVALTEDGHHGHEYWITGPEALTIRQRVHILGDVLGREVRFVELSRDEVVARWRGEGYSDSDIEFFLQMRTDPPEAGRTVRRTVEEVTGVPARTFAQSVEENAAAFLS